MNATSTENNQTDFSGINITEASHVSRTGLIHLQVEGFNVTSANEKYWKEAISIVFQPSYSTKIA